MNLGRSDRDRLRKSQYELNQLKIIGNLIEHKTQNPREYKQTSNTKPPNTGQLNISYISKYKDNMLSRPLAAIQECREPEVPLACQDLRSNVWLNMDQVEFEKLEWMTDRAAKAHDNSLKGAVRFDKDGRAIPEKDITTEGHDISALTKLLDSTYQPQVTFGLTTISKVASLATVGYYDGAFDENIHQILLDTFLLRVRHHLDSPNETICQTALKCLRSLICNNHVDEVLIDRLNPAIYASFEAVCWLDPEFPGSFPDDMKDIECVKMDAIMGLLYRTDILNRLLHLLRSKKDGPFKNIYYDTALDIMIRIARHSPSAASFLHLGGCFIPLLIQALPMNISQEKREVQSMATKILKLIRIVVHGTQLVNLDKRIPLDYEIFDNPKVPTSIMPLLQAYFFIDCFSLSSQQCDLMFKLSIETLRLLKVLCRYSQFIGRIKDLLAYGRDQILSHLKALAHLRSTKLLESRISFDWQYYAHLIDLLGYFMRHEKTHLRDPFTDHLWGTCIKPLVLSWIKDIVQNNIIPHLDVSIAIAATLNHYRFSSADSNLTDLRKVMITPIVTQFEERKSKSSNLFKILANKAIEKGQIAVYLETSGKIRDPKGLPSFGCLNFNNTDRYQFKLNPIFDHDSPFLLLNCYITQLKQEVNLNRETLKPLIDSVHLIRYIRSVTFYHKYPSNYERMIQDSFITQYEIQTIGNALVLLSDYYLEMNKVVDADSQDPDNPAQLKPYEPIDLKNNRTECYSNFIYYAISIVGLLDPISPYIYGLKDKIFERVLFNPELHKRIVGEVQINKQYLDLTIARHKKLSSQVYTTGLFPYDYLNVLEPLYMNSNHHNRFWIFQPMLNYIQSEEKSDKWFRTFMTRRFRTGELITFEDSTIISVILLFNATMLLSSPCYSKLVIQPDLETYLCLIASVFMTDDLFLNEDVSDAVLHNLNLMLSRCLDINNPPFQDASKMIEPLNLPLKDIFNKLVDQYESVSYGDEVFSNFLYLFLTNKSDKIFRKKLFQEKVETCLSQLRLVAEDVWLPERLFFGKKETDPEIVAVIRASQPYLTKGSFIDKFRQFHS